MRHRLKFLRLRVLDTPNGRMHAPSLRSMSAFSRDPSLLPAFAGYPRYYGLIRHPANCFPLRCLIGKLLSRAPDWTVGAWASEGFPSSVPSCLTMSSLIPRKGHKPSTRNGLFSASSVCDTDFVYQIETRPLRLDVYEATSAFTYVTTWSFA